MEITLNLDIAQGSIDTKEMKLVAVHARGHRMFGPDEIDASLCIKAGMNLVIAEIHTGEVESSNNLCDEIVYRFNNFPKDYKR